MDCSIPGHPVHHQLLEFTQTHVHWVSDAIQPSHSLSSLSSPTFNLSHHQGLLKRVSYLHQVAKVSELQLQHQFFQWIFRTNFLQDWLVWFLYDPRDCQESSPTPEFKSINSSVLSSVQLLSHVRLFETPWIAARQASLSITTVLPLNIQDWFPLGWTGWISLQSKGLSLKSLLQHHSSKASILRCSASFIVQLLHP